MSRFTPRVCSGEDDEAWAKTCRICLGKIKKGDEVVKLYRGKYRHTHCEPAKKTGLMKFPGTSGYKGQRVIRKGDTFS